METGSKAETVKRIIRVVSTLVMAMFIVSTVIGCGSSNSNNGGGNNTPKSSRAYAGHESDVDINNFVQNYPSIIGSRLDDCQTCHRSATLKCGGKDTVKTTCDYCHLLQYADTSCVAGSTTDTVPHTFRDTLNPYGKDYMDNGRSKDAVKNIDTKDSDGDSFANGVEVLALRYPGDKKSFPGQAVCPIIVLSMDQIKSITPKHSQLMLANTSRQQFDDYANFEGVKVIDLLNWLSANKGVSQTGLTSIAMIAPDGFSKSFPLSKFNVPAPYGILKLGLDVATLGPTCGFVNYPPASFLVGLSDGATLGIHNGNEQWSMIAYNRNGASMQKSYYNGDTGKLEGEGPYRFVLPQFSSADSNRYPDRGQSYSPSPAACSSTAQYDYLSSADHNAGNMTRGLTVMKLEPMPSGCEEFDWKNGGFAYIDSAQLVIYGNGVPQQ
jgi:hypothetical protein